MAEPIVLGIVGIKNCGEYNSQTNYEKLNIVTYQGSTYCALTDTIGHLPTETDYWQLYAEKGGKGDTGDTGPQGPKPVKGVDYYTSDDIEEIEDDLSGFISEEVSASVGSLTTATPLVASSVSGMTDTTRIYVNSTDGHWYWYNGSAWQDGGVYQSTALDYDSVTLDNLSSDIINNFNTRTVDVLELKQNKEYNYDLNGRLGEFLYDYDTGKPIPSGQPQNVYISNKNYIFLPKGSFIKLDLGNMVGNDFLSVRVYFYDKDFNYINYQFATLPTYKLPFIFYKDDCYVNFTLLRTSGNPLTIQEVEEQFTITIVDDTSIYKKIGNLINPNYYDGYLEPVQDGYINVRDTTSYRTTPPIPLKANTSYKISKSRMYTILTDFFNIIEHNSNVVENYTITPTIDCYIMLSPFANDSSVMFIEGNTLPPAYTPQKLQLPSNVDLSNILNISATSNVLYGKKLVTCGDSFTQYTNAQFDSGIYEGQNRVWPFLIGLRNGMTVHNMAVSGSTMAINSFSGTNFADTLYTQIDNDADYIIIKYGINDINGSTPIGTIDSTDDTTFYGAWNKVMPYIIQNHPTAKIGIIVTNGLVIENNQPNNSRYANAIIEIAKKYGIPTLNEWNDPNVPVLIRTGRTDVLQSIRDLRAETFRVSSTNTHENYICQEYESTIIEDFLRRL